MLTIADLSLVRFWNLNPHIQRPVGKAVKGPIFPCTSKLDSSGQLTGPDRRNPELGAIFTPTQLR
ncbi:hypothetical protein H9L39_09375 [Fusarium oxysporum f. sp. albedinis]|nr:hypothetical protein H9L39_09375 [Fusarium oxysporum f. sp. albedinis]